MTSCTLTRATQLSSSSVSAVCPVSSRHVTFGPVSGSTPSPVCAVSGEESGVGVEEGGASESEEVEDVDEEQPVEVESSDVKASRRIAGPSRLERAQHEVLHTPYREWCRHCQASRGRQRAHARQQGLIDDQGPSVVHVDFGFLRRRREATAEEIRQEEAVLMPVLCCIDQMTQYCCYLPLPSKAVTDYSTECFGRYLTFVGHRKIFLKSDGESSLLALKKAVKEKLNTVDISFEASPPEDSASNGRAEQCVQSMQGLTRTQLSQLSEQLNHEISVNHPCIPWLVCWSSFCKNVGLKSSSDGRTPYERLRNRRLSISLHCFGEIVRVSVRKDIRGAPLGKLAPRFVTGVFVGVVESTLERLVLTPQGLVKGRTLKSVPPDERFCWETFDKLVNLVPWSSKSVSSEAAVSIPSPVSLGTADFATEPANVGKPSEQAANIKDIMIRKKDLEKYGFDPKCPGCRQYTHNTSQASHTPPCRSRLKEQLKLHEPARYAEWESRVNARIAAEGERLMAEEAQAKAPLPSSSSSSSPLSSSSLPKVKSSAIDPWSPSQDVASEKDIADDWAYGRNGDPLPPRTSVVPTVLPTPTPTSTSTSSSSSSAPVSRSPPVEVNMDVEVPTAAEVDAEMTSMSVLLSRELHQPLSVLSSSVFRGRRGRKVCNFEVMLGTLQTASSSTCVSSSSSKSPLASSSQSFLTKLLSSRQCSPLVASSLLISNLAATTEDVLRNPDRPVAEEAVDLDDTFVDMLEDKPVICSFDEYEPNKTYYDQNTGLPLDKKLVEAAMKEEVVYMQSLPVWVRYDSRAAIPHAIDKHVKTRWVLTNKGDASSPDVRARLVAQEIKYSTGVGGIDPSLFSATPPLEALRALVSRSASSKSRVIGQIDVKKAHLYGLATRRVSVDLPDIAGGGVGVLVRTLYGTRDAASAWEAEIDKVMSAYSLTRGLSNPCLWKCSKRDIALLVHGDDLVFSGSQVEFDRLCEYLLSAWKLSVKGTIGPAGSKGSLRILGRLLSYNKSSSACYELEGDPRHAELLARLVSGGAVTPGVKLDNADVTPLSEPDHVVFRSSVMRAAYLSLDRPEIQFACVQLARAMSKPTKSDQTALFRLCKFLRDNPRVVQKFSHQKMPTVLHVECDSDFAGNVITRKSTSSFMSFLGNHCLGTSSKTQSVIALSSGEAEFYALGSAVSRALGLRSMLADLGISVTIEVVTDSSACLGTAGRLGLGKAKHISTAYLWVQQVLRDKLVTLGKVWGEVNRSDLGTKHLAAPRMWLLLGNAGYHRTAGKHDLALSAS